jgi:hypothetical protein
VLPLNGYLKGDVTGTGSPETPLGQRLSLAIKARSITQSDLAWRSGVPRYRFYRWRQGWLTPTAADLDAVARELGVNRLWLETGAGPMEIQAAGPQADRAETRNPADWGSRPAALNGDSTSADLSLGSLVYSIAALFSMAKTRGVTTNTNQTVDSQVGDATQSGPPAASLHPGADRSMSDLLKTVREMAAVREMWATARELATTPGRKVELTLKSSRPAAASDLEFAVTVMVRDQP